VKRGVESKREEKSDPKRERVVEGKSAMEKEEDSTTLVSISAFQGVR
jgi:hypothetical protein